MTHDDIRAQFERLRLTNGEGMALLADSNTISDEAVQLTDICLTDIPDAVRWLKRQKATR